MDQRYAKNYAKLATISLLVVGCLFVLRPFLAAILFAAAVVISSWPLYLLLLDRSKGRRNLAALSMTLSLTLVVILPIALVAYNLADDVGRFYEQIKLGVESGIVVLPSWLRRIPLVGAPVDDYLRELVGSRVQMMDLAKRMLEPARHYLLNGGMILGAGVAQMTLAAFVSFFLYRDGERLLATISVALERIMGESAAKVAEIVSQTVRSVMYGLLGTALAQSLVAGIGFTIAGVPAVPLLSVATFVMSLVPVGPPIIWGGAAIWLFSQGNAGWGIFMLLWGLILISGVDNVVKPILISRGSSLPFLLVFLGVLGGVIAFGFVGLFIGPTLLAVGYSLMSDWTGTRETTLIHPPS
ncbi:MAG: AI-2E family transporter [Telluria sp.]|nr:AI-2E family transporter [Telluria sp.]